MRRSGFNDAADESLTIEVLPASVEPELLVFGVVCADAPVATLAVTSSTGLST
jgi:hypothetical protein